MLHFRNTSAFSFFLLLAAVSAVSADPRPTDEVTDTCDVWRDQDAPGISLACMIHEDGEPVPTALLLSSRTTVKGPVRIPVNLSGPVVVPRLVAALFRSYRFTRLAIAGSGERQSGDASGR